MGHYLCSLVLLAGLSPVLFVITGFVIWWNKRKARRYREAKMRAHSAVTDAKRTAAE